LEALAFASCFSLSDGLYLYVRCAGLFCTDWVFWSHTALLLPQHQWPQNGWLSELLLWMGNPGLLSRFNGGMLCSCGCFRCHLCNSWYSVWFSCCHHGHSKNLAEALPYPHQEGTYKGSILIYWMSMNQLPEMIFHIYYIWYFLSYIYCCKYLQEYIVEDLRGCYFPPKLDPEHEGRLKMLKLLWLQSTYL